MSTPAPLTPADLVVGKTYLVEFEDCCVQGSFTDTLIRIERMEVGTPTRLVFQLSTAESLWGGWTFTEVEK